MADWNVAKPGSRSRPLADGERGPTARGLVQRLDDITRLVSDWVWETDEDLRLTYLSFRVFEVLGFHSLELVGRRLTDLGTFEAEDGSPHEVNWRAPFRDVAFHMVDRAGSRKDFLVSGLPVYSPDTGTFTGVLGTARDITKRRRAEKALQKSESHLRAVVGNIPVILFAVDRDGVFTLSEGKGLEALGLGTGEVVGKSAFDVYGEFPEVTRQVRRALSGETVQGLVDVGNQSFEIFYSPTRDEEGQVSGFIGVAANVTGRKRAQKELLESEERFRNLVEGSLLGIVIDRNGEPIFANQAYALIFGYDRVEDILALGSLDALYHPEERPRIDEYRTRRIAGLDAPARYEFQGIRKDGTPILVETQVRVVTWRGEPAVQSTVVDVTERRRMLENLRQLSQAVEQSPASVVITDPAGAIEYVNPKFVELTGYSADEALGQNPRILKSGKTAPERYEELWATIAAGKEWRGELLNRKKNGELYWELASISPIKDANGAITHFLAVKEDITLRKEYEKRLIQQANYDEVTGLPNRVLALDRLEQSVARSRRHDSKVGLLFLDLDRFKLINDTHGHEVGDHVLRECGQRIRGCLRGEDTVARLGGDEFTIILPDINAGIDAEPAAHKILEEFKRPFTVDGLEMFMTPSIGITIWPDDGEVPADLLRNADTAMYRAKKMGRNNFRFFTPELNEHALTRSRMENQIRHALDRDEFELHYQPVVDLVHGRVVRAEALLRWRNRELGVVEPNDFIPLAEEIGLIVPIGEWVLQTACKHAAVWQRAGLPPMRVSVNVSDAQFRGRVLTTTVIDALKQTHVKPENLELEFTEGLLTGDIPEIADTLETLDGMGIRLAVDDFGTGFASLASLRRFPIRVLKVDGSFLADVTPGSDGAALVEAIVNVASSFRIEVIAEGVETDRQIEFLRGLDCECAQGHYFSPPLPEAEFVDLIKGWEETTFAGTTLVETGS